jgi:MFS transporter, NNP family, nitrate/nitrite transporter
MAPYSPTSRRINEADQPLQEQQQEDEEEGEADFGEQRHAVVVIETPAMVANSNSNIDEVNDDNNDNHVDTPSQERDKTAAILSRLEEDRLRLQDEWDLCMIDPYRSAPESKFERYEIKVDHHTGDRGTEILLHKFGRPHMRSLHCAWISFFLAFMIWFSPAPLLRVIGDTLHLTKEELWTSSITNDCTAIFTRIIMGPVCDIFAARIPMAAVLILASIPTACLGLVNSAAGLAILRFFIGIAGSSFVMAQFWPSRMFAREIAGTANGIVGGWGNLGGAWTQLFMGTILLPAFTNYFDGDEERAWRTIAVIPASMAFSFGLILPWISDDAPMGNYGEMKKKGTMDRVYFTTSLRKGATRNTWILYIQYAACFGVELVMNNASVLYFTSEYGLSTEQASTLGFLYGSMNIFARAMGGIWSDDLNMKIGMRGRLWLQTILLILEGIMIVVFSFAQSLVGAVIAMCIFSVFTQASEGAIYGVVPYVSYLYTGAVSGFVGSGGNMGSVVYGFIFRSLSYRQGFLAMGGLVIVSSFLTVFIDIPCHAGLIFGEDNHAVVASRKRYQERRDRERQAEAHNAHRANMSTVNTGGAQSAEAAGEDDDDEDGAGGDPARPQGGSDLTDHDENGNQVEMVMVEASSVTEGSETINV